MTPAHITCEGTKPLILHEYTMMELFSMWDGSLPLRAHAEAIPYYDQDERLVLPRAVLQAVLTRAATTIGIELTKAQRLIPGIRIVDRFMLIVDREDNEARIQVDARTGDGRRGFRRMESVSCVLPRFDRWRFTAQVELGENITFSKARRIWDTAGRLGLGDGAPSLGQFVIQSWVGSQSSQSLRRRIAR